MQKKKSSVTPIYNYLKIISEYKYKFIYYIFLIIFIIIISACAKNIATGERQLVILSPEEERKTFSGIPKQISYDETPNSECTMSIELYNYSLEDSHE